MMLKESPSAAKGNCESTYASKFTSTTISKKTWSIGHPTISFTFVHPGVIVREIIDFCYPRVCVACDSSAAQGAFCADCSAQIDKLAEAPACEKCAMPITEAGAPCPYCFGDGLKPYDRVIRLSIYVDPIKSLIHRMKYHQAWNLGEILAARLLQQPGVQSLLSSADVLVPVPLHPIRQISRGFNQAEVIARRLAKFNRKLKLVFPALRLKHTETQTHLAKTSRLENLKDAFGLNDGRCIQGNRVVVVDDVLTTGATLQSFGRTLKQAEFASINAITIAIADPKNRDFQAV
jgi:ComF family protein